MILLDKPVDDSEIDSPVPSALPVEDMTEYDLTGTEFYKDTIDDLKVTVRRWFLVRTEKLDSGDCRVFVEVHDQKFLHPYGHSTAPPVNEIRVQELEKEFEKPDYDSVLPWVKDEITKWLSEWDEDNPPVDLLPSK